MGAEPRRELLPPLLRAVRDAGHPVVWACDPMHANTIRTAGGRRPATSTRSWPRSRASSPRAGSEGTWPGGVHLEFTGEDVTECLGGGDDVLEEQLDARYETLCDPRLNARQSLDLAFRLAELMQRGRAGADGRALAIVGTGLIGASVGLAARRGGAEVARLGPDPEALAPPPSAARSTAGRLARGGRRRSGARRRRRAGRRSCPARSRRCSREPRGDDGDRRRLDEGAASSPPPAARRGSSAATRSAGSEVARPGARDAPSSSRARPGSSRRRRHRPRALRALHGFVVELGAVAGRGRAAGARPARRADEPPAARAREPARRTRPARLVSRDTSRSRPPAARCAT